MQQTNSLLQSGRMPALHKFLCGGEFTRKVVGISRGITSSGMGRWALLKLECGHSATLPTVTELQCGKCGKNTLRDDRQQHTAACECGSQRFVIGKTHECQPDKAECETCKQEEEDLSRLPELVANSVHSRFRPIGSAGMITFYGRDSKSPTGVLSIGSVTASPKIEQAIRKLDSRISPLSPTEGLSR